MAGHIIEYNVVELNLPECGSGGELPDPSKPVVTINGVGLDGVTGVKVEAGNGDMTVVTISFYAAVTGKVHAATEGIKTDDETGD